MAIKAYWKDGSSPTRYGKNLQRMARRITLTAFEGMQTTAVIVEADLKRTTPRSNEGGNPILDSIDQAFGNPVGHVADGWTHATTNATRENLEIEIYNDNPRFNRPLQAGGGTTTLGEILEYGSRPHVIEPKNPGGRLVFFWPVVGDIVRFKKVNHPGTRPYAMMISAVEVGAKGVAATMARASQIVRTFPLKG